MNTEYDDIRALIAEPPRWWDEFAVPRYCDFHPRRAANIYAREGFRRTSLFGQVARGSIIGLGPLGYIVALDAAAHLCKGAGANRAKSQIQ